METLTARTAEPLCTRYDGLVCDLDGVVYRGPVAVPGAVDTLNRLVTGGLGVVFATNNASRPPGEVAVHLAELGLADGAWTIATSSEAAAAHLALSLAPGARVLAVGGPGVPEALTGAGLQPVRVDDLEAGPVEAIVQGLGVDVTWRELAEIAHLSRDGVPWVATNLDITLPSARGATPGNGALVALVRTATDAVPDVVGKPGPALYELSRRRLGTEPGRTLACGDRLDTDIAGAIAAGLDSLLVLSGAHGLADLAAAAPDQRPTYVATDLTGLCRPPVRLDADPDWDELSRRLGTG